MNLMNEEVVIGNRRFRLTRMTPLVGVRVMNVLFGSIAKSVSPNSDSDEPSKAKAEFDKMTEKEKADVAIQSMWMAAATVLPAETYEEIQKACLRCCQLFPTDDENDPPIPVMMSNGKMTIDLDLVETSDLILKSMQFNLGPFFTGSASKKAEPTAPLSL